MKRYSPIEGYTYELSKTDVESFPEFNSLTESDFIEFKPSIFILKSGYRKNKFFSAFFQIGNSSKQIAYLPISNCTSVKTSKGVFELPYDESFDSVAQYALNLVESGRVDLKDLISNCRSNRYRLEDILNRNID